MKFSIPGCQFIPVLGTEMRSSRDELIPPKVTYIAARKLPGTELSSSRPKAMYIEARKLPVTGLSSSRDELIPPQSHVYSSKEITRY